MIVLDANVLIAHLDASDALHTSAERLLRDVVDHELAASPVTLAQVLTGPARAGLLARAESALDELGVIPLPLTADAPRRLALLRAETGLRMPDCCVVLAAEQSHAALATFDQRLASAARARGFVVNP